MRRIQIRKFSFRARVWKYQGTTGWFFVTLPELVSARIRRQFGQDEEGWGRLRCRAEVGLTSWRTAIWFDTKKGSYLLPLKAEIRRRESVDVGAQLKVQLQLSED